MHGSIRVTERVHHIHEEFDRIRAEVPAYADSLIPPDTVLGRTQWVYDSPRGQTSMIENNSPLRGREYEILCLAGGLFGSVERYATGAGAEHAVEGYLKVLE